MSLSIHMSNGQTVQYIDEQVNQKLDEKLTDLLRDHLHIDVEWANGRSDLRTLNIYFKNSLVAHDTFSV